MKNFEKKISVNKEKIIGDFLDKYFPPEAAKNDGIRSEPVEIKRDELKNIIETGETMENLLNQIKERGYFFHGSPNDIKKLEARRARDMYHGAKENTLKAVYATNIPEIALFHAIICPKTERKGLHYAMWEINEDSRRKTVIKFKASQFTFNGMGDGYVYILEKKDFAQGRKNRFQFSREGDCVPSCKIPVRKEDFTHEIEIVKDEEILKMI